MSKLKKLASQSGEYVTYLIDRLDNIQLTLMKNVSREIVIPVPAPLINNHKETIAFKELTSKLLALTQKYHFELDMNQGAPIDLADGTSVPTLEIVFTVYPDTDYYNLVEDITVE